MLKGYSKFLDVLEKVEKAILAITVGVMVIIIAYQVIMRYIFAHANSWSEELARYLFIYDVMIGAAIASRRNSHLQIDILINLMKPKVRTILTIVATLAGMVFMGFLLSYSITLVQTGAKTMSAGLGIPMSIPYACMPIGLVLMLLGSHMFDCPTDAKLALRFSFTENDPALWKDLHRFAGWLWMLAGLVVIAWAMLSTDTTFFSALLALAALLVPIFYGRVRAGRTNG